MQLDLCDKNILLTGASDGIGKGVADFLMKMGARVAVHYNTNYASAESLVSRYSKTGSKSFKADLSIEKEVLNLFSEVKSDFGKIDIIILNAGVFLPHSTTDTTENWLKVWKKTININLNSVGLLTKLGIDHLESY